MFQYSNRPHCSSVALSIRLRILRSLLLVMPARRSQGSLTVKDSNGVLFLIVNHSPCLSTCCIKQISPQKNAVPNCHPPRQMIVAKSSSVATPWNRLNPCILKKSRSCSYIFSSSLFLSMSRSVCFAYREFFELYYFIDLEIGQCRKTADFILVTEYPYMFSDFGGIQIDYVPVPDPTLKI